MTKVHRTEVDVVTHCDELQVDKANRTEVDVVSLYTCSWNCNIFVNGSLFMMSYHLANSIGFGIKQGMVHFVIQSSLISFLNIDKNNNV
jgi:hypothetical protein